jgi:hypothetical protein
MVLLTEYKKDLGEGEIDGFSIYQEFISSYLDTFPDKIQIPLSKKIEEKIQINHKSVKRKILPEHIIRLLLCDIPYLGYKDNNYVLIGTATPHKIIPEFPYVSLLIKQPIKSEILNSITPNNLEKLLKHSINRKKIQEMLFREFDQKHSQISPSVHLLNSYVIKIDNTNYITTQNTEINKTLDLTYNSNTKKYTTQALEILKTTFIDDYEKTI